MVDKKIIFIKNWNGFKGGLMSERFKLLPNPPKKVPNHAPEHYAPK